MNPNTPKQVPRHDDGLHVLEIGRVSTPRQNESNIEASYDYVKPVLEHLSDAPIKLHQLGEQSSGMVVERETMLEAYELIENGWPDVVLMEDLSKAYRNPRWALALVQDCMDQEIRVIAPGDNFDSFDENCEVPLQAACLRHGLHIPDTRRRVRRTASYAFERGGMVLREIPSPHHTREDDAMSFQFNTCDQVELQKCGEAFKNECPLTPGQNNTYWTNEVRDWFYKRAAPETRPYPRQGAGEYLVDLCHLDYDDHDTSWAERWTATLNRGRFGMRLALECEWDKKRESILDDAGKLALLRAEAKVMVFGFLESQNRASIFDDLRRLRSAAKDTAPWLCIDVPYGIAGDPCVEFQVLPATESSTTCRTTTSGAPA